MDTYTRTASGTAFTCKLCSTSNSQWARCAGPNDSPSKDTLQPTQCANNYFLVSNDGTNQCVAYASVNTCLTLASTTSSNCQSCLPGYNQLGTACKACPSSTTPLPLHS